jgi:pimeloyl-ACP methyl ester carboxylesterase
MAAVYRISSNVTTPTLAMLGTQDRTIGPKGNEIIRTYWEKRQAPAFLLELPHGGHYSFTGKGDQRRLAYLEKNHWPELLIWKPKNFTAGVSGSRGAP